MSVKPLLPLVLLVVVNLAHAERCEFKRIDSMNKTLAGVKQVELNARAGELEIESQPDAMLQVRSQACSDTEKHLAEIRLEVERKDESLIVTVVIGENDNLWDADYAYADLLVKLPSTMPIVIRDSSGDITMQDVSVKSIDDSSGKISGTNLHSDLEINDSSGDIVLNDVVGSISLTDSSGDMKLTDIKGDVNIAADGSGEIKIIRATGTVGIGHDGSDDIEIENTGTVRIGGDGSGDIRISDVDGAVYIGTDGSGIIDVSDINGDFTVDGKGSGDIRTRRIKGTVSIPPEHR